MKQKIFMLAVAFLFLCVYSGYAQEGCGLVALSIVKGRVVETDWVSGKIVIRLDDAYHPDQMTFFVDDRTVIMKGTDRISFADVLQEDYLTIGYHVNSFAGLQALTIDARE